MNALVKYSANLTMKNIKDNGKQSITFQYDYWLLLDTCVILILGLLLLTSASLGISTHDYHNPFHFLIRQIIFVTLGIFIGSTLLRTPIAVWEKISGYLLLLAIFLLMISFVPGIGRQINGSIRWIGIGGLTVQVSELAKFGVIVYIAGYLVRRSEEVQKRLSGFLKPLVVVAMVSLLLLLEPDFGAMVVVVCTVLGMIFLGGARLWQFMILMLFAILVIWLLAIASPYRLMRLTSFLNPWDTPYGSGYQLIQSLIAFGRGGFWGIGLGNGIQKLFYLPEAHTDFLFAVLAEELGIFGQMVVISLFVFLVSRAFYIAILARRKWIILLPI